MDKNKLIADHLERTLQIKRRKWNPIFRDEMSSQERKDSQGNAEPVLFSFARISLSLFQSLNKVDLTYKRDANRMIVKGLKCLLSAYFSNPVLSSIIKEGFLEFPLLEDLARKGTIDLDIPNSWHSHVIQSRDPNQHFASAVRVQNIDLFNYFRKNKALHLYPILCDFETELYWNLEHYKVPIAQIREQEGTLCRTYAHSTSQVALG